MVCEGFSRDIRGAAPNYRDITLSQRMARRVVALLLEAEERVMLQRDEQTQRESADQLFLATSPITDNLR